MKTITVDDIRCFLERYNGTGSVSLDVVRHRDIRYPIFSGEFWSARQRQGSSLHEISYRGCFKSRLPAFFIEHLTRKGDMVYDPFAGRGTTPVEAALQGRYVRSNDLNPLSEILTKPRLRIPPLEDVGKRLETIPFNENLHADIDLSMFFHPRTEAQIVSLKMYLAARRAERTEDTVDAWIRMVATNRLTGHSPGFFSVYTLPPNQAVLPERQRKINKKRNQKPEYKDIRPRILAKTKSLLRNIPEPVRRSINRIGDAAMLLTGDARHTPEIPDASVDLVVTSPPFLDVVQYHGDNWMRCWFNGIDAENVAERIREIKNVNRWCGVMRSVMKELYRVVRPGGWVAFEVGEVRRGTVRLDERVVPLGIDAGFTCAAVLIQVQSFTKTSNIWGIRNNAKGTNTNRIVLFRKN